ncbi:TPA: hypothetical protein ACSR09_001582 [Enterobacter hormaechei subsp. steigerwaltii]|uniref:hypothetical protein n=1 Tax=Enterobacter hormaechei TaxID=158836 RepID=UPI0007960D6D|nr:hypothetical protein [Enterobacter hormaechei]CZX73043.1 Uncharacterised protein [Enterobacter hormaechei]
MTLTKEWLQKTISQLEEERDATPGAVNEDAAMALASKKLALASLEAEKGAEPVAKVETVGVCWYADNGVSRKPALGTELFTAPPAPVVPDELAGKSFEYIANKFQVSISEAQWILVGWSACRAAMLQGAEQTNYRAIVERIAEIIHGKVTDIDLLTVTVKSMKDKLQK